MEDQVAIILPTNILLEATAADPDGMVSKVEFFDNGQKLGSDLAPPYAFLWTNAGSGTHVVTARATDDHGFTTDSAGVIISAQRWRNIAYLVPAGTVGGQNFRGALGMDFEVLKPIVVPSLGIFDSGSDGLSGGTTLTVQLYARSGNAGTLLRTLTFNAANPGALTESSRRGWPRSIIISPCGASSYGCTKV